MPVAVPVHLEPRLIVLQQQRQRAGIGVVIDAEVAARAVSRPRGRSGFGQTG
jgi:hypothetical protein